MKRTYRVSVVLGAEFDRKVNSRAHARDLAKSVGRELLRSNSVWHVVGTKVTSKAVSERTFKVPLLDPAEPIRDAAVVKLQGIADVMGRILVNVKKPRIRRWPNCQCGPHVGVRFGRAYAHAHTSRGVFYGGRRDVPGGWKRLGVTYGLICVHDRALDQIAVGTYDPVDLMAHEVAHLKTPSKVHAKVHGMNAHDLEVAYREVIAGTRVLPVRSFPKQKRLLPSEDLNYSLSALESEPDGVNTHSASSLSSGRPPSGDTSRAGISLSVPSIDTASAESGGAEPEGGGQ